MAAKSDYTIISSVVDVIGFILLTIVIVIQSVIKSCLPKSYQNYKGLKGEIVLITGGGGGLGRLLAVRLAQLEAVVVLWDVNIDGVYETVKLVEKAGGKAYGFRCDLADKEDVYKMAEKTRKDVGDVSILINNAGVVSGMLLLDTPDHLIKRTFDVNILAHFWTVKAFLPKMIEKKDGHIVTIASMAGHVGINKLVDYCSSKYAAVGFDEALRVELESQGVYGVKTTAICPYFMKSTGMFETVNSRFVPTLKLNDVADRIIEAIEKNEQVVMIPSVFKFGLMWKTVVPWAVVSMFLRGLVPDAVPENTPITAKTKKPEIPPKMNNNLSTNTTQNRRVLAVSKNS